MEGAALYAAAGAVFSAAAFLQGFTGFGFGVLSVGVLAALAGPRAGVGMVLPAAFINSTYLAWRLRRHILFKETLLLGVTAFLCLPLGALFLKNAPRVVVMRGLGVAIVVASLPALWRGEKIRLFTKPIFRVIAGVFGGFCGGAFLMPGPPLLLYAYNCAWPTVNAKANLQFLFSLMSVCLAVIYLTAGHAAGAAGVPGGGEATRILTVERALVGLSGALPVLLFSTFGDRLAAKMRPERFSKLVNVVLLLLGMYLVAAG